MTISETISAPDALSPVSAADDWSAQQLSGMIQASKDGEHERVRCQGYPWLRFPPAMEQRYREDTAAERLKTLRIGGWGLVGITLITVAIDAIMVPDQMVLTFVLRLLCLLPLNLLWLQKLDTLSIEGREKWLMGLVSLSACVLTLQVLRSESSMAPPYLMGLSLYVLVIGAMLRAKFWNAMKVDAIVLVLFSATWWALPNPLTAVLIAAALALSATVIFTLWGAYRLEHTDRTHWLMQQHERHLQDSLEGSIKKLDELSRFDALTHLPNRREFYRHLQLLWSRTKRDGKPVAILLIDIDHFKPYNDNHGHVQGDECLAQVAQALHQSAARAGGMAARWGGEEFIVVLSGVDAAKATWIGQSLLDAVAGMRLAHGASPVADWVTCSMGAAVAPADGENTTPEALVAAADAALYQAKASGRACLKMYDVNQPLPAVNGVLQQPVPADSGTDAHFAEMGYSRELAALNKRWSGLRFSAALETRYQHDTAPRRLKDFLITGLLALGMFSFFLPVDYLLANDVWEEALHIRLMVFTPFWASVILLFWVFRDFVVQKIPQWVPETMAWLSGITAGATLSFILASSTGPLVQYYHIGLMVVIIYGNLVQRMRFWFAVAFSAVIYAMHLHGAFMATSMDSRLIVPIVALVGAAGIFTLMANYAIDRDERASYLLSLRRRALIENLHQVHGKLSALVRVDPLTEQFNRRHASDFLQHAWVQAANTDQRLAVIMVDVDHFKAYNDHYGHPAGDACLVRVAKALAACVRGPSDLLGRYGGEEFVAILSTAEPSDAHGVAERMRAAVEQLNIPHAVSSAADVVTISLGVACLQANTRLSPDHVLQAADQALYRAKHQGRNRVSV